MRAFDTSSGTQHASTGRSHQYPIAAAVRAGLLGVALALPADAATTQLTADDAHRRPTRRAVTLSFPHRAATTFGLTGYIGGIDRPRVFTVFFVSTGAGRDGVTGCSTGVVSTSNRSLGVQSRAVHNAISVVSLTWLGSLVNSADTDAADISNPRFLGQQPAQLGAGPHLPLRRGHPQPPPDLHAKPSSPLSSASVDVTARR